MKRFMAFILALVMVFLLAACGTSSTDGESGNDSIELNDELSTKVEEPENNPTEPDEESSNEEGEKEDITDGDSNTSYIEIESFSQCYNGALSSFHEGYAWVCNNEDFTYYCIDQMGHVTFYLSAGQPRTSFSNGYAHVCSNNGAFETDDGIGTYMVINTSGEILSSYESDSNTRIVAYGDGYTVVQKHITSFDTNHYEYTIYNPDGSAYDTITFEKQFAVSYCGSGVIEFSKSSEGYFAYFISSKKMVDLKYDCIGADYIWYSKDKPDIHFYDDYAVVGDDFGTEGYTFLNLNGTLSKIDITPRSGISEGHLLSSSHSWCIYDIENNTYSNIDENYSERISIEADYEGLFKEGLLAIRLIGSDNSYYIVFVNYEGNVVTEPIPIYTYLNSYNGGHLSYTYQYAEGRLIVKTDLHEYAVYDTDGTLVYSLTLDGYNNYEGFSEPYSEGVCFFYGTDALQNRRIYYYDMNGAQILNTIYIDQDTVLVSL